MLDKLDLSDSLASAIKAYLTETLHAPIEIAPSQGRTELPVFIGKRYRFYETIIARQPCLIMGLLPDSDASPADIAKSVAKVGGGFDGIVAFASKTMTSTTRSRLIAQGVPFIVPGNQLYIPQLAIDLREHFRAPAKKQRERLTPAAQLVLFHHILNGEDGPMTPSVLAQQLEFAAMSIGRAFDQLAQTNLATIKWRGRQKVIHFNTDRRLLLALSRTLLRTPVRGLHGVRFKSTPPTMLRAGETALSDLTDLAPPERPSYAILATGWHEFFRKHEIESVNDTEAAEAFVETWRYDPHALSEGKSVDPLSLHAQYWDHPDERVAQAAVDVLEKVPW